MKDIHKNSIKFTIFFLDGFRKHCYFLRVYWEKFKNEPLFLPAPVSRQFHNTRKFHAGAEVALAESWDWWVFRELDSRVGSWALGGGLWQPPDSHRAERAQKTLLPRDRIGL